jgi:hypothetical protein
LKKYLYSFLGLVGILLFLIAPEVNALPGTQTVDYGEKPGKQQSYEVNISDLHQVDSVIPTNGDVTYVKNGEKVTLNFDNGTKLYSQIPTRPQTYTLGPSSSSSFPATYNYNSGGWTGTLSKSGSYYQVSDGYDYYSCSTSIGPQTSSSFPSSTTCTDSGVSVTATTSGSPSTSTGSPYTTQTKTERDTCSNSGTMHYDKDGKNTSGTPQSCPGSLPYSDSQGYSGTLSRGSTTGSGCPDRSTPFSSCNWSWTASYSGTVSRSVPTTYYTQSYSGSRSISYSRYQQDYSGTASGPIADFYNYGAELLFQTNTAPTLTEYPRAQVEAAGYVYANASGFVFPQVTRKVSRNSTQKYLRLQSYSVYDLDFENVTVSATIAGKTKSSTVNAYPANGLVGLTGGTTYFSLGWDAVVDNIPDGTYTYRVTATDARGKTDVREYGEVVVDSVLPVVTGSSIVSNNATSSLAKVGDQVSVAFTVSKELRMNPTVTIGGKPATLVKNSTTSYTAYRVMDATDTEGAVSFVISNVEDTFYNRMSIDYSRTTGTNSTAVRFDRTLPTATSVVISTNAATSPYMKAGDRVRLQFTVSEQLRAMPTVTIFGKVATVTGSYPNYNVYYYIDQNDPDGPVPFVINFADLAGNNAIPVTATTDGSEVYHYTVPPRIFPVTLSTNNSFSTNVMGDRHIATVNFTIDKPLRQLPKVTIGGVSVVPTKTGDATYRAQISADLLPEGRVDINIYDLIDAVGKPGPTATASTDGSWLEVDRTAPTLPVVRLSVVGGSTTNEVKAGDVILLEVGASEKMQPTIALEFYSLGDPSRQPLSGIVPQVAADNRSATFRYTVKGTEADGLLGFRISNYLDVAYNVGLPVTKTTDGSSIHFGSVKPALNPVTIRSNNTNPSIAEVGDTITVRFTADKPLDPGVSVSIGGSPGIATNTSSNVWEAARVVTTEDQAGPVPISIVNIKSVGSLVSGEVSATSDGSSVTITKPSPTLTNISITSSGIVPTHAKEGTPVRLVFTASETLDRDPVVGIGSSFLNKTGSTGNTYEYIYTVKADDEEGELGFVISNIYNTAGVVGPTYRQSTDGTKVIVDTTIPVIEEVKFSGGTQVGDTLVMTFLSSERLHTNPAVSLNGRTVSVNLVSVGTLGKTTYRATQAIDSSIPSGQTTYYISNILDLAGNLGNAVSESSVGPVVDSSSAIMITISGVQNGGTYESVAIPVYTAASSQSSDVTVSATMDGLPFLSGKPVTGVGEHTMIVYATDGAGNSESLTYSFTITQ